MADANNRWTATRLSAVAGVIATLALVACGGGSDETAAPPAPPPPTPPTSGLDQRPSNMTCVAPARATETVSIALQRAFASLSFSSPVAFMQAPADNSRWFVVEQGGRVLVFPNDPAASAATEFINITGRVRSGGEMGLLGMAFAPGFPADNRVFLSYTNGTSPLVSRLSVFTSPDGGLTLNPASETVLLTINQPETNHNGGNIVFGPDGNLYIGMGDGGGGGDQHGTIGNGQDLNTLLGKFLRINVGTGATYTIPADNPFVANARCNVNGTGTQPCAEIYAWGFRNPWRWSFDRQTGELWAGDVGQNAWEEIDVVTRGGNFGWRIREAAHCFNPSSNCATTGLIDPVAEYDHSLGISVTGGYVYRGNTVAALRGRYLFGDFGSGRIWTLIPNTQGQLQRTELLVSGLGISSFGEANDGELYLLNYNNGQIMSIQPAAGGGGAGVATSLAATGCVSAGNATQPASGLIPYAPSAAFWSDGATKERWIGLPNGQNITVGGDGDWDFPSGTVLVKNFRLGTTLVETRLFMRHPDGVWAGYSYEWNAQQTDATLVMGGKQGTVAGQTWIFPSESQCLQCHTAAAGRSLGLETRQLAFNFTYPQTSRNAHQLVTLNSINVLSPPVADPTAQTPYPDPYGASGTLTERARSYLHTNCSQCHRPQGTTPSNLDLRYSTALPAMIACNVPPQAGDLGIANAVLIAPGEAARSVLVARANRRDTNAMPPVGSARVDTPGVTLLTDWINSLANCN